MAPIAAAPSLDGYRILLVEDSGDIRDVLGLLLRSEGAEVRTASTGRAALEMAADWDFDVLLTDLGLPDLGGEHLIREILGMKGQRLRVVAMTGFGEPYHARARAAGARAVLTKPLDWALLKGAMTAGGEALAA